MRLMIQNMLIEATLDTTDDPPILTLEYEQSPIDPEMAHNHRFEILQATDEERQALAKAGYRLPDHRGEHGIAA